MTQPTALTQIAAEAVVRPAVTHRPRDHKVA